MSPITVTYAFLPEALTSGTSPKISSHALPKIATAPCFLLKIVKVKEIEVKVNAVVAGQFISLSHGQN